MGLGARRTTSAALAVAGLLVGCGDEGSGPQGASPGTNAPAPAPAPETEPSPEREGPPPVTVRFSDESVALQPWSYCYGGVCIDGSPPAELVDVGGPEEVVVEFPLPGWSFTATFRPAGDECGREQEVPLEAGGGGRLVLRPAGRAGAYDVTLFGRGDGDLVTTFRWVTPVDGAPATPRARLAVLAGRDGQVDSYGVELELTNLARTPRQASATITVEAADGSAVTFDTTRSRLSCLPEGTVYWDGPDDEGLAAAALGEGPFAYRVELLLDGERYVAAASWPADEIPGNEPSVALELAPSLPVLP